MKKRNWAALLVSMALVASLLTAPGQALGSFSDVHDETTARNVEVLRLMGIVSGVGDGRFNPEGKLTRAEFCKMLIELMGKGSEVERYRNTTIFPDVRATHWAAGYVNYAVKYPVGEKDRLIHGLPDGTFAPDRSITMGEAATLLMRVLDYGDADAGAIWPAGYLALAGGSGVSRGVTLGGSATITRSQAAQLFVNMLTALPNKGTSEYIVAKRGCELGEETSFLSVDLAKGELRTGDGKSTKLVNVMDSTILKGLKGRPVLQGGKVLTFLPSVNKEGSSVSDGAVIVAADASTAGFDAITGGSADYRIFRNGVRAGIRDLKKNDVAVYSPSANAVLVCDTRVVCYYEGCTPSPDAPESITTLGGTTFTIMDVAQQTISRLKPGMTIVLMLSPDGRVAGAVENGTGGVRGNALAYVDSKGAVSLLCGGELVKLALTGTEVDAEKLSGSVVRVVQSDKKTVALSKLSSAADGALDLAAGTVGSSKLASDVMVFRNGERTSLDNLGVTRVEKSSIAYVRLNGEREVDLVVINTEDLGDIYYGRALVETETKPMMNGEATVTMLSVEYGNDKTSPRAETANIVHAGDFVAAQYHGARDENDRSTYPKVTPLTKFSGVASAAWLGKSAVTYSGQTFTVPENVACYNRDSGTWFADLDAALAYKGTMNLYVSDGVVRVIEVYTR